MRKTNVDFIFSIAGFTFSGSGQNAGMAFIHLKRLERSAKAPANGARRLPGAP